MVVDQGFEALASRGFMILKKTNQQDRRQAHQLPTKEQQIAAFGKTNSQHSKMHNRNQQHKAMVADIPVEVISRKPCDANKNTASEYPIQTNGSCQKQR